MLESKSVESSELERLIEALLFVADGPLSVEDLAKALVCDVESVDAAVAHLLAASGQRGVCVERIGRRLQMVTIPEAAPAIERLLGLDASGKLSSAALETLAIVAYRQPITRVQVEAVRGVNSEGVLRSLLAKSLIAPVGRLEQVGRPVLYGTTFEFLQYLGIRSLEELPALPELPSSGNGSEPLPQLPERPGAATTEQSPTG